MVNYVIKRENKKLQWRNTVYYDKMYHFFLQDANMKKTKKI